MDHVKCLKNHVWLANSQILLFSAVTTWVLEGLETGFLEVLTLVFLNENKHFWFISMVTRHGVIQTIMTWLLVELERQTLF